MLLQKLHTPYDCARNVLAECHNEYAKSYAQALLTIHPHDLNSLYTQMLYLLGNLQHWRGDGAKVTRDKLRELIASYRTIVGA